MYGTILFCPCLWSLDALILSHSFTFLQFSPFHTWYQIWILHQCTLYKRLQIIYKAPCHHHHNLKDLEEYESVVELNWVVCILITHVRNSGSWFRRYHPCLLKQTHTGYELIDYPCFIPSFDSKRFHISHYKAFLGNQNKLSYHSFRAWWLNFSLLALRIWYFWLHSWSVTKKLYRPWLYHSHRIYILTACKCYWFLPSTPFSGLQDLGESSLQLSIWRYFLNRSFL